MIHSFTTKLEDIIYGNISYDVTIEVEGHLSENNGDSKQLYPEIDSIVVTRVQSITEDGIMIEHRSDIDADLYTALLYIVSHNRCILNHCWYLYKYDKDSLYI